MARYSLGGEEAYHSESRDLGWLARGQFMALSSPLKKYTKHRVVSAAWLQPPAWFSLASMVRCEPVAVCNLFWKTHLGSFLWD